MYIVDYEVIDGITPNSTDPCTLQYLAAPICLLYKNAQNKILPIAIQVQSFLQSFFVHHVHQSDAEKVYVVP